MAVKICPKCKESNKENATSCINCGESLVNVDSIGVADDEKVIKTVLDRCPHCDKRLNGSFKKCPYCGNDLTKTNNRYYAVNHGASGDVGIYILSFFIPLAGIIIGAIWLASNDKQEEGGTAIGLAVAGIAIGAMVYAIAVSSALFG